MIKEIIKDTAFLRIPSVPADINDIPSAQDLADTLRAHHDDCVGMAANMIGVSKRIIAVSDNGNILLMFNPEIIRKTGAYEAEEGCLSLAGTRKTKRFHFVRVRWQDEAFQTHEKTFHDFTAQIIQHEIDHLNGVII